MNCATDPTLAKTRRIRSELRQDTQQNMERTSNNNEYKYFIFFLFVTYGWLHLLFIFKYLVNILGILYDQIYT